MLRLMRAWAFACSEAVLNRLPCLGLSRRSSAVVRRLVLTLHPGSANKPYDDNEGSDGDWRERDDVNSCFEAVFTAYAIERQPVELEKGEER